jgi:hypothetical protein
MSFRVEFLNVIACCVEGATISWIQVESLHENPAHIEPLHLNTRPYRAAPHTNVNVHVFFDRRYECPQFIACFLHYLHGSNRLFTEFV